MKLHKQKFEALVKQKYGSMVDFCQAFGVNRANIYAWFNGRDIKPDMVAKLVAFLECDEMDVMITPPLNQGLLAMISHKLDQIQQETGEELTADQTTHWLALIYNSYAESGKMELDQFKAALSMRKRGE